MSSLRGLLDGILRRANKTGRPPPSGSDPMALTPEPSPQDATAWQGEARRLAGLGRWEDAIHCLDKAIDLNPQCADAWYNKGCYLGALGRLEEAIGCYGRALALDPQMAAAWFSKALAEERIGCEQEAAHSYRNYIAVAPVQDQAQIEYARRRVRELGHGGKGRDDPPLPSEPIASAPELRRPPQAASESAGGYRKGDCIGEFEVQGVLGQGGFGVVYLVHLPIPAEVAWLNALHDQDLISHGQRSDNYITYALKTFRDEYLNTPGVRQRFRHEAQTLVDLDRHPHLLRADFVDEIAGRLYVATEYIAPNAEGLNSLEGYLLHRPSDLAQSLRWAIQVCHGMEYALSKGLRCHRDLKPSNILITADCTAKIADFGLAGMLDQVRLADGIQVHTEDGHVGLSAQTVEGAGFGTPTHMPPEQFTNAKSCDERSDIYAFGVVLYQMATGGRLPFLAALPRDHSVGERRRFWAEMHQLHATAPLPRLDTPLFPIVERCLAKQPDQRYQSFLDLRQALEPLLRRETGEVAQALAASQLTADEWHRKGYSLAAMGLWEKAIECYDRSVALESYHAATWTNKGICLDALGRREEAIICHDRAVALNPTYPDAWNNKGVSLVGLGRHEEAIACFDRALALNPQFADAWNNKGVSLKSLGRWKEAFTCADLALAVDPLNAMRWSYKAESLGDLGRPEEAIACCDRALAIDPQLAMAWNVKANNLATLERWREALDCSDQALVSAPEMPAAWITKGASLAALGRREEAIVCYERALALDPHNAIAWNNRANNLISLGRMDEALIYYEKALSLDPGYAHAWRNRGNTLLLLGHPQEALACFDRVLALDPQDTSALTTKGTILAEMGRLEEARACHERGVACDPQNAYAWLNKALVEERLGRLRDAVCSYERFIAVAPAEEAMWIEYARQRFQELK